MKWLKRKFRNWIDGDLISPVCRDTSINSRGFNIRVFKADGGIVIESEQYDDMKDRHHRSLHVIVDGEDIGERLGKIITYESLKS